MVPKHMNLVCLWVLLPIYFNFIFFGSSLLQARPCLHILETEERMAIFKLEIETLPLHTSFLVRPIFQSWVGGN